MAETLYDENVWWPYGNTHIAIGSAYKDALRTDPSLPTKEDRENRWFNDSAVHTDIVSTTNRTVTATLSDGSELVIYKDGEFVV
jgi:aminopeptidase